MRNLAALATAACVLCGAACTNDYDAILDQAGGGASSTSSTDATSSAGGAASSSSTSSTGGSSTATGAGGDGAGGIGGSAGTGGGGAGGGDLQACPGIQLDLGGGGLPQGWHETTDDAEISIGDGRLKVTMDAATDGNGASGFLRYDIGENELKDCSVATSVEGLPGLPNNTQVSAFLALRDRFNNGLVSLAVVDTKGTGETRRQVMLVRAGAEVPLAGPDDLPNDVRVGLRVRAVDGDLFFDISVAGSSWENVGGLERDSLDEDVDRLSFGASRRTASNSDPELTVALGPVNAD